MSATISFVVNDKRTVQAWALFDWANSSFALVITAAIFPAYYTTVVSDTVEIMGGEFLNSSVYAFAISLAYLLVAAVSPLLSGIADYSGRKKFFLKIFTTVGALACMALFFFKGQVAYGTLIFMLAMMGFAGGLVFYNSYLPVIVTEDRYDAVSAKGFAYGFIGSVILMLICLVIILNPGWFGLPYDEANPDNPINYRPTQISFILVGLWWIGFAQIPFRRLPKDSPSDMEKGILTKGFNELKKVWNSLQAEQNIRRFLLSFLFLSAGIQTALYLAPTFAKEELKFETWELIITILILQIVAIGGALFFAKVSEQRGNKFALLIMLFIWMLTCVFAYFIDTKLQFYAVAVSVGILMGGTQALARATYSKLLPVGTTDTASYFSFYDVVEKVATVLGTFIFGFITNRMDSMRPSVLALGAFFLLGLIFLQGTKIQHLKVSKK